MMPTLDAAEAIDHRATEKAHHWFSLAQLVGLPERLLVADPDAVIDAALDRMTGGRAVIETAAREAYRATFRDIERLPRVRFGAPAKSSAMPEMGRLRQYEDRPKRPQGGDF